VKPVSEARGTRPASTQLARPQRHRPVRFREGQPVRSRSGDTTAGAAPVLTALGLRPGTKTPRSATFDAHPVRAGPKERVMHLANQRLEKFH
jgi:hypothetical protein